MDAYELLRDDPVDPPALLEPLLGGSFFKPEREYFLVLHVLPHCQKGQKSGIRYTEGMAMTRDSGKPVRR